MSVINIWLAEDHAMVASDSLLRPLDDRNPAADYMGTKMAPLPMCGAVLAFRGERTAFTVLWGLLSLADIGSFDGIANVFGEKVVELVNQFRLTYDDPSSLSGEYALVGWCDKHQKMRCLIAVVDIYAGDITVHDSAVDPFGMYKAPDEPSIVVNTPEAMAECARIQVAQGRAEHPEFSFGGDLLVATIRRGELSIRNMGNVG